MKRFYGWLGGASLLLAALASYLTSSAPDGLERVSADLELPHGATPPHAAPLPDYQIPGLGACAGPLAGVMGVLAVLALSLLLGWLLKPRKTA